jgi:hypothetical protein
MSAVDGGGRFQGFGTLCARAGAGDAIATKEKEDVGGVGVRIVLMDKEWNKSVIFVPSLSFSKGANLFVAVAITDSESGGEKMPMSMAEREKKLKAERRRDT